MRTLPLGGLGLLLGIDRFMATGSAVTNVIGNAVAVLAIARWDNAFDRGKFDRYLESRKTGVLERATSDDEHAETAASLAAAQTHETRT
jgi:aerobic C4-dicarboxylate transport protein